MRYIVEAVHMSHDAFSFLQQLLRKKTQRSGLATHLPNSIKGLDAMRATTLTIMSLNVNSSRRCRALVHGTSDTRTFWTLSLLPLVV